LYSGNDANPRSITGVNFQPDFVWLKDRTQAANHRLVDVVRGAGKTLKSNTTDAETSSEALGTITAFTSDGFTVQGTSGVDGVNLSGDNYVAWNWKANGTAVTNTAGTISAQVSANTTSGFSVVTYTGTGANATVGHGLGVAPSMVIIKNRDSGAIGGAVYHTSIGATKYLKLFQTTTGSDGEATDNTAWNGSSPTFDTNVFSVGSLNRTNSAQQMVAYCFAQVAGYSAFGSYTGNGSNDGTFVFTGFRPRFLIVKRTNDIGSWIMTDSARSTYNVTGELFNANTSGAEFTTSDIKFDYLSNGFKLREVNGAINASGSTYIYMAFAENPFKYSLAR
jgi:hypothetical protein